ncbi:MAG: single-stranded-DNA-specific exonuclease RecJ [Blautia sp.]|nr:single-stranded-DNA-specific exonuclease RecJ [Blautia sp.]
MARWAVYAKKADFKAIAEKYGIDQVTARIIRNRDAVTDEEIRQYISGKLSDLPSPHLLKDADKAAGILAGKISEGRHIRILGDYDIDGVSATYILKKALKEAGADVDHYIPDRILDGYGINGQIIEKAIADNVDTIVTCDNGISAAEEIQAAKDAGMTVIVTDHHEVPYTEEDGVITHIIPPADAVVDPKQPDCQYPTDTICGAVVAFKVMQVLYELMGLPPEKLSPLVEIEAVATIGDVMELKGENRILVREGLKRLEKTKNTGLRALIRACGLENNHLTAYHIGFVIGPCINASGRLDTAARALSLLEAESEDEAAVIAGELFDLNVSRKAMTEESINEAQRIIEDEGYLDDRVLVVFLPQCHESLAGIVAGRIREKYYRPTFIITRGQDCAKGSGRSTDEYPMFDEMSKLGDLFIRFGGHKKAAGFSISEDNIPVLRKRINEQCTLKDSELTPKVLIDVAVPIHYLSRKLVREIDMLEPFGNGNPKPLFAQKNLRATGARIVGKNGNVVKMKLQEQSGFSMEAIYFGDAQAFMRDAGNGVSLMAAYRPEINNYRGMESLQVIITDYVVKSN